MKGLASGGFGSVDYKEVADGGFEWSWANLVVMGGVYSEPAGLSGLRPALQGGAYSGEDGMFRGACDGWTRESTGIEYMKMGNCQQVNMIIL